MLLYENRFLVLAIILFGIGNLLLGIGIGRLTTQMEKTGKPTREQVYAPSDMKPQPCMLDFHPTRLFDSADPNCLKAYH
jgi:hypothetical protein